MAQIKKSWLVRRWRRYALPVVAVLVLAILVSVIWGKDIRVWWILSDIEDDREETMEQLRLLDLPYRGAIKRATLRGGRILTYQADLCGILLQAPYYDRDTVEGCLADEDPVIRRAAAMALLRHDMSNPAGPVPDAVLEVLRDWGKDSSAMWLDGGLAYLSFYRDKRIAPILLSIVTATTPDTTDAQTIGRSNSAREVAAQRLAPYIDEPGVIEGMREVLGRERESEYVKLRVLHTFLKGGYSEDLEVFWMAARHENPHIRQVLADNLEFVKDPRVIPVLEFLLEDTEQVVRRGAVLTLARKRHPCVMDDIHYLAEDSYGSIKGDLAEAVKDYRRDDLIPFVIWCLSDYDPVVVEKAIVTLGRMAKTHHEFDWDRYKRIGRDPLDRMNLVKDFMNDEERKARAIEKWVEEYPPRKTELDRVPHLVRQLAHADRRNVKRAIKELYRITKRADGLPEAVIDPAADANTADDALEVFLRGDRKAVMADWQTWYESQK